MYGNSKIYSDHESHRHILGRKRQPCGAVVDPGTYHLNFTTVFCETGWEHPLTYEYIHRIADKLHLDLVTLKSKKYDGMVDLARQKKRWPSTRARFCTEELKTKPTIDYVLDEVQDNMLMIQGIRAAESASRASMSAQCTYFKYYFEPYGYDKNGKPKKHTYRSKDVRVFREKFADDLLRPVFDWSAQQVIDSIFAAGLEPNPLYRMGYKRVGCWPCVMANQRDILSIARQAPERIDEIASLETELKQGLCLHSLGQTKFPPTRSPAARNIRRSVMSCAMSSGRTLRAACSTTTQRQAV